MKRQLWLRERQLDYQQAVIRSAKQTIHQARYAPADGKPDIPIHHRKILRENSSEGKQIPEVLYKNYTQ